MARSEFIWRVHPCKKFWSVLRGGLLLDGSAIRGTTVQPTKVAFTHVRSRGCSVRI